MDPDRARIEEDLKGLLEGQVRCDDTFLHLYASDASLYEMKPIGVVRPMHTADVVACVNYARENDLTIIPRGAGSNVLGGTLGNGLILDFSYSMRRILSVDRESVTVQPGLVLGDLNDHLASHGRMFGPDPFNRNVSTIGGMLSMNTSGSHWLKTGTPRDHVITLQVVLASGDVIEVHSKINGAIDSDSRSTGNQTSLYQLRMQNLLDRHEALIAAGKPNTKVNQAGYNVFDLRSADTDGQVDLTRLFVGCEGTLGIITEAKLKTMPVARHRGVVALFCHSLETAARAAVEISKSGVVACDLLDRRLLSLARERCCWWKWKALTMRGYAKKRTSWFSVSFEGKSGHLIRKRQRKPTSGTYFGASHGVVYQRSIECEVTVARSRFWKTLELIPLDCRTSSKTLTQFSTVMN